MLVAMAACFMAGPARADVRLSIHDGLVSVSAHDATLRQILSEWARIGQTKIINLERVPGGPINLEFVDLPESRALEVLMRSLSGYLAAPRPTRINNASRFDRIIVMPTAASPRTASPASAAAPRVMPAPFEQPNEEPRVVMPPNGTAGVPVRAPVFNTFPTLENGQPPPQPTSAPAPTPPPSPVFTTMPTAPPGLAAPGLIAPPPPQPPPGSKGQPNPPQQP
jgi:hypothetical protein